MQHSSTYEEISACGLGYGIDASDIDALRKRHGKVRVVHPDLSNVKEIEINSRDTFERLISTMKSHKKSVIVSLSDIAGDVFNISAEEAFSRKSMTELVATGKD